MSSGQFSTAQSFHFHGREACQATSTARGVSKAAAFICQEHAPIKSGGDSRTGRSGPAAIAPDGKSSRASGFRDTMYVVNPWAANDASTPRPIVPYPSTITERTAVDMACSA